MSPCLPVSLFPCLARARRAFTLVELLVTLTMFAVIAGGIAMAFHTSLQAFARVRYRAEVADERRTLMERLHKDLQGAWLRRGSSTTWFMGASSEVAGTTTVTLPEGTVLSLTTARPVSPDAVRQDESVGGASGPQSDVAQVSWGLEQAPDGTRQLVRRERTPPDAEVDETLDPTVARTVLAQGVREINLRFFDGSQWLDQWDTNPETDTTGTPTTSTTPAAPVGLPELVEVTVVFDAGNAGPSSGLSRFRSVAGSRDDTDAPRLKLDVALPQPLDSAQ